jgi:hypothetical protein
MRTGFDGVIYGNPRQLGVQTLAVVVVAAYAGVGTFIICWIIDKTFGLKISPEKEEEGTAQPPHTTRRDATRDTRVADNANTRTGLDITEHKEFAYHNLMLTGHELYDDLEEIGSDDGAPATPPPAPLHLQSVTVDSPLWFHSSEGHPHESHLSAAMRLPNRIMHSFKYVPCVCRVASCYVSCRVVRMRISLTTLASPPFHHQVRQEGQALLQDLVRRLLPHQQQLGDRQLRTGLSLPPAVIICSNHC